MLVRLMALAIALVLHAAPPQVGNVAPDFQLQSLDGSQFRLSEDAGKGPVVLIVLRGFPGYQCPLCNRQVQEFVSRATAFADAGARVVMVYPGPRDRATEFVADKKLPPNFHLLLDPAYQFTNLYSLRWEAPRETAYPSTFIIDAHRKIRFAKISNTHAGRSTAAEVLAVLSKP